MRQDGEPSVEEILESIKKVIDRDNREAARAERHRRETAGVTRDPEPAPQTEAEPADPEEAEEVLELQDMLDAVEEASAARGEESEEDEALTTEGAAQAMRQSLAALAMLSEPGAPPQIVRSGETSLEGMVREMLRPMLAQWLETHLPEIVDRQVKAEIARIAGKKR